MNGPWVPTILGMPLFRGFTEHGAQRLLDLGRPQRHAPGERLCQEGDPAGSVLLVLAGTLRVYIERGGVELAIDDAGPGTILGEIALLCGIPRTVSVRALDQCAVLYWTDDAFRKLLFEDALLSHRILGNSLRRLIELEKERVQSAETRHVARAV